MVVNAWDSHQIEMGNEMFYEKRYQGTEGGLQVLFEGLTRRALDMPSNTGKERLRMSRRR
jgi:hypothetical protein